MTGRAIPFKQADVHRAVKGATSGGMQVGRVEIDPTTGKIVLIATAEVPEPQNDLDRWMARDAR